MDLYFLDIRNETIDGNNYVLQRAIIGNDNRRFWIVWKGIPDEDKKRYTLTKEDIKGCSQWVIYRRRPLQVGKAPGTFKLSYKLRSVDKLLPYQPRSVAHLCQSIICNGSAADGTDTGLGKTYTALAVSRELDLKPAIICKKAGIAGWKKGCAFMGVKPFFIINWETAKNGKQPFAPRIRNAYTNEWQYTWRLPDGIMLIFDEAHLANHDGSQNYSLYKASRGLTSLSMSATFADRPVRLKFLFHVLGVKYEGKLLDEDYFDQWFKQDRGAVYNQYTRSMETLSELQDMGDINKILYPDYGYRLSYDDPDVKSFFPEAVFQSHIINLSRINTEKQNALYQELCAKVVKYREMGKQAQVLVADLRYRQASELLKAEVIVELVNEYLYEGKSVAVFVNFKETLAYLSKTLKTNSLIFGQQEKYGITREEVIDNFQSNRSRVILCMVGAGGTSIDLHDLHGGHPRISLVCPTYNAITLKQVLGRTYRAGSKTKPVIKLIYAADTVEEKVAESVSRKLANISALNDGDLMEPDLFQLGYKIDIPENEE